MNNLVEQLCTKEIEELHQFFQDWFNGVLPETEAGFAPFPTALGESFTIVSPQGTVADRQQILEMLWAGYGKQVGVRIWIEGVRVSFVGNGVALAMYEEWQENVAREMPAKGRLSSVLFQKENDKLTWLHVHETWLP
jgi:hypothetical protein